MIDWGRLNPRFWSQNEKTDWEWDKILNNLLDKHPVVRIGGHTARVGPLIVWVGNWPYQYGYCDTPQYRGLPSTATRKRLKSLVPEPKKPNPMAEIRELVK